MRDYVENINRKCNHKSGHHRNLSVRQESMKKIHLINKYVRNRMTILKNSKKVECFVCTKSGNLIEMKNFLIYVDKDGQPCDNLHGLCHECMGVGLKWDRCQMCRRSGFSYI